MIRVFKSYNVFTLWSNTYNRTYRARHENGSYFKEIDHAIKITKYNKIMYFNGICHCEYGPAIIWNDGRFEWYLNGTKYKFNKWLGLTPISNEEKIMLKLKYA